MLCPGFVQNQVTGRAGRSRVIREAGAYLKIPENFSPPDGRKWYWSSNPILVAVSARARAVAMVPHPARAGQVRVLRGLARKRDVGQTRETASRESVMAMVRRSGGRRRDSRKGGDLRAMAVGRGRATSPAAPAGRVCGWGPRL